MSAVRSAPASRGHAAFLAMVVASAAVALAVAFHARLSLDVGARRAEGGRLQALWLCRSAVTAGLPGTATVKTVRVRIPGLSAALLISTPATASSAQAARIAPAPRRIESASRPRRGPTIAAARISASQPRRSRAVAVVTPRPPCHAAL